MKFNLPSLLSLLTRPIVLCARHLPGESIPFFDSDDRSMRLRLAVRRSGTSLHILIEFGDALPVVKESGSKIAGHE
ncbi:hypothetical protein [Bradyrhizobium sp. LA2.1]|uniref:hypothetical protein n=1 Tax=Bradyrhizobium sp. LA2.1 TaxID=3156376 RepID=UPI00339806D6